MKRIIALFVILGMILPFVFLFPQSVLADISEPISGDNWSMEEFMPTSNYTINRIDILLYRVGNPTIVHVDLYAENTTTYYPETLLASGDVDCSIITTDFTGEWVSFTLDVDVSLDETLWYDIVVTEVGTSPTDYVVWRATTDWYSGAYAWSNDAGVTWNWDGEGARNALYELRYCAVTPADAMYGVWYSVTTSTGILNITGWESGLVKILGPMSFLMIWGYVIYKVSKGGSGGLME